MKAPYGLTSEYEWQNHVVVMTEFDQFLKGNYDGYGRVGDEDIDSDNPECWHQECYREHGEPKEYTQGSEYSSDQGYFYDGR